MLWVLFKVETLTELSRVNVTIEDNFKDVAYTVLPATICIFKTQDFKLVVKEIGGAPSLLAHKSIVLNLHNSAILSSNQIF
mgnify:CR=1 FL=1